MGSDKKDSKITVPPEVQKSLLEESLDIVEKSVQGSFEKRREFLISAIAQKLKHLERQTGAGASSSNEEWLQIDSLSGLRALVGGRFQNLRDRWTGAGFPLKEHRGEKNEPAKVNQDGWIELSNWIMKQGFEARLCPDIKGCLFQIRKSGNV